MRMMIVVVVALAGCGPNFAGSYSGTLGTAVSCSDGSGQTGSGTATWDVLENGSMLTLSLHGQCDPLTAKIAGNVATVDAKTCPQQTAGGITETPKIVSGTLTLNEPDLAVTLHASNFFTDGVNTLTCTGDVNGSLRHTR